MPHTNLLSRQTTSDPNSDTTDSNNTGRYDGYYDSWWYGSVRLRVLPSTLRQTLTSYRQHS